MVNQRTRTVRSIKNGGQKVKKYNMLTISGSEVDLWILNEATVIV